jgi:hypothetical protein
MFTPITFKQIGDNFHGLFEHPNLIEYSTVVVPMFTRVFYFKFEYKQYALKTKHLDLYLISNPNTEPNDKSIHIIPNHIKYGYLSYPILITKKLGRIHIYFFRYTINNKMK